MIVWHFLRSEEINNSLIIPVPPQFSSKITETGIKASAVLLAKVTPNYKSFYNTLFYVVLPQV